MALSKHGRQLSEGFLALKGSAFRRALLRKLIRVYLFLSSFLFFFFLSPPGEKRGGLVPNEGNPTSPSILINTTAIWRTQPILHARVNPQRGKSSCFNFSSDYRPPSFVRATLVPRTSDKRAGRALLFGSLDQIFRIPSSLPSYSLTSPRNLGLLIKRGTSLFGGRCLRVSS